MISDGEILRIAQRIEDANNIDIKETIEKASTAGYLGEEHFYCTVIEEGGITHMVPEIFGDMNKSMKLDNLYFDIISKALDHEGIYISDDYDLDEDEYEYMMEYALITADDIKKFRVYAEEGIAGHERMEDVGLIINIIDGDYKAYFALRSTDQCMSSFRVLPFTDRYPKEHPLSLMNPINKILIGMIDRTIVLK